MAQEDHTIRLKIFGEEYTVKSKADEAYLQNIASYVDTHMREISENLPTSQPTLRIAILAAMNISDELFAMRKQYDELEENLINKSEELTHIVEDALQRHSVENMP